jgi:hypothetical protein
VCRLGNHGYLIARVTDRAMTLVTSGAGEEAFMARPVLMWHPMRPGTRTTYEGYSWTTFFWGFFPALFRGDWLGLLIGLGVLASCFVVPLLPFIIWAAFYNQFQRNLLVAQGWYPVEPPSWGVTAVPVAAHLTQSLTAAPGWSVDPSGSAGMRWWNGSAWTEERR